MLFNIYKKYNIKSEFKIFGDNKNNNKHEIIKHELLKCYNSLHIASKILP